MSTTNDPDCHLAAAGVAAIINFPLWRASAIAQSGFQVAGTTAWQRWYNTALKPPYRGTIATVAGLTWARAFIFYGSDYGRTWLQQHGVSGLSTSIIPPLFATVFVQFLNMPLVRSTITVQNPHSDIPNVRSAMLYIYRKKGFTALWHGTSAGIMKAVPKYCVAVAVKDIMDEQLPHVEKTDKTGSIIRAAWKSTTAGVAGAVLTNPADVIRNEMFKTDQGLVDTTRSLYKERGLGFITRGLGANIIAVSVPVTITIFAADIFRSLKYNEWHEKV